MGAWWVCSRAAGPSEEGGRGPGKLQKDRSGRTGWGQWGCGVLCSQIPGMF